MIKRYTRKEMEFVWSDQCKFDNWLAVEIAACEAHVELGNIQQSAVDVIKAKAAFDVERIKEIESEIHHDVIAFLTSLAENIGPESRFVHMGLTSTDVVDTAFCLQIQAAGKLLMRGLEQVLEKLEVQAKANKTTLQMGRTHGVHAEPLSFGLKLTVWYSEMQRNYERLRIALEGLAVGKLSGAVGNYANLDPDIERLVCQTLSLTPASASTQTLQRDRHAHFMTTLAIIAGSLEKMATEFRALQKTEFGEVYEPFDKLQKGSSAMPHKKNPILGERITGLSRLIRSYALTALENQALWHERDISHSSAERVIFPDATIALDYALSLMIRILDGLVVCEDRMMANINGSNRIFFSQPLLLVLVNAGLTREDAYRLVQKQAMRAHEENVDFQEAIMSDESIMNHVTHEQINDVFSFDRYTKNIDKIYQKIYK
ncbi:MAG: adenylosuccinate lyase [Candidatus Marinamargulisbacteria bacterium]|nr:adenylosuccinate lyase [bacterium]MDG2264516.1 adenylosuccinate lyase [Candidatus Marinamargulisbacteria bacterium]